MKGLRPPHVTKEMRTRAAEATDAVEEFFLNAVAQRRLIDYIKIHDDEWVEMGLEIQLADVPNIIPELMNMAFIINLPILVRDLRGGYYPPRYGKPGRILVNYGYAQDLKRHAIDMRAAAMDETRLGRADKLLKKFAVKVGRERPLIAAWIEFLEEKGAEVFRAVRQTFFHEVTHHLDYLASRAAKKLAFPKITSLTPDEHYNMPSEIVAYVQQALHAIDRELLGVESADDAEAILGKTAAEFSQRKSRKWLNKNLVNTLTPENLTRLDAWLQEYWADEMAKFPA